MSKVKHISFDLDGTLINSKPIMQVAWKETMIELGLAVGFDEYKKYIGIPFIKIMEQLGFEKIVGEISSLYFQKTKKLEDQIELTCGAIEILAWCNSNNISTSIITSKPRKNAVSIVSINNLNVDLLICGDDNIYGKPSPENGMKVLKKFNIRPEEMIYVGDMIYDLQFAQNLGSRFIHFSIENDYLLPKNLVNQVETISDLTKIKKILA